MMRRAHDTNVGMAPERTSMPGGTTRGRWLLLIHQIPRKPDYLRVKISRRLAKLGAVAIKNSVYALPYGERSHEDLQWVRRQIIDGGGEASVCEAEFVDGLLDNEIEALFHGARNAEYAALAEEVRRAEGTIGRRGRFSEAARAQLEADLARFRRRLDEVALIDYFGAPGRQIAEDALASLQKRLRPEPKNPIPAATATIPQRGSVWVTRQGLHVDRMASAWLIRRFIDPDARFRFVPTRGHEHRLGEFRFDMVGGEFTHEGDACSFEVLAARLLSERDPAIAAIGEVVHDLDLRDGKFGRPETHGIGLAITGLCLINRDDAARLEAGEQLFGALYEAYRRRAT